MSDIEFEIIKDFFRGTAWRHVDREEEKTVLPTKSQIEELLAKFYCTNHSSPNHSGDDVERKLSLGGDFTLHVSTKYGSFVTIVKEQRDYRLLYSNGIGWYIYPVVD